MDKKRYLVLVVSVGVFVFFLSFLTAKGDNSPAADSMVMSSPIFVPVSGSPLPGISRSPAVNSGVNSEMQAARDKLKQDMQASVDEFKQKKTEIKAAIETARENLKTQLQTKATELKQKLQIIKDTTKQTIVENINTQIAELNDRTLAHYSDVLDKLDTAVDKITARAKTDSDEGLDITSVTSALTDATTAITAARKAIQTQTGKTYTIKITTESNLRIDVGATRQALHADLVKVRDLVIAARVAVHKATVTLAQLHGIILEPLPSPSVSPSPSATP